MVEIAVSMGNKKGMVRYWEKEKRAEVSFPFEGVQTAAMNYLTSEREFKIPESDGVDDFRIDQARPVDNRTYFDLAMCSMYSNVGLWVDWSTERETED